MRSDRGTKLLLVLIAAALWALTMTQLVVPEAQAGFALGRPQAEVQRPMVDEAIPIATAPTSTRPLRWRVANAVEAVGVFGINCMTVVQVINTGPTAVDTDVEWFSVGGSSLYLGSATVGAGRTRGWVTDLEVDPGPFQIHSDADLPNFSGGYAHVNADDPRVLASAFRVCREGTGTAALISIGTIPVHAVGATAEYFQAGLPMMRGGPPVAAPDGS